MRKIWWNDGFTEWGKEWMIRWPYAPHGSLGFAEF